jgi:ABC-2 type transport system ATP-binding protein
MFTQGSAAPAVRVAGVIKRFGRTVALAGVDLEVAEGTVFGLLGPNGAGKTTLVRVLATLLAPDSGHAEVFGRDVVGEAPAVRELLGLTGQFAAVDEILTGRENLQMFGRLFDLSPAEARRRAAELLERFELADAADRPARTYSGGCAAGWTSRRACSPARGFCFSTSPPLGSIREAAMRSGGSCGSSSARERRSC